jgi:hypothetical protein
MKALETAFFPYSDRHYRVSERDDVLGDRTDLPLLEVGRAFARANPRRVEQNTGELVLE